MVVAAIKGAIGFLTTLPAGLDEPSWDSFRRRSWVAVVVGYVVGVLVSLPIVLCGRAPLAAFGYVLSLVLVTGIAHLDGLTDLADAIAVHGPREDRIAALGDSAIGVGGAVAVTLTILGLYTLGWIVGSDVRLVGLIVAAEVSAKWAMILALRRGTPRHDGLGSAMGERTTTRTALLASALAMPAAVLTWPSPAGAVAVLSGVPVAATLVSVSTDRLGGINGDVLGATNEVARLVALTTGVIAWTHL
ncbi:MAG: adenosylcobinamide-GDP ribazoletransferase [Halanaeroarchaeum sp.]